MFIAPVVFKDAKSFVDIEALLLAIVTPPPTVFSTDIEMLVRKKLATKARSPLTAIRFGAITFAR